MRRKFLATVFALLITAAGGPILCLAGTLTIGEDFAEKDEIRQSFELSPGTQVRVSGINGSVDVETADTTSAEVHVVRSARNKLDLETQRIIIENTPGRLLVRGENEDERRARGVSRRRSEVRQRITLRLPRAVNLVTEGVNGPVRIGAIEGPVEVTGVNGPVEIAQASAHSRITGVNGRVGVTVTGLSDQGVEINGINGAVELRLAGDLNADVTVDGINGGVSVDVPNLTVQGKINPRSFRGRIGSGGSTIAVSGVNGHVRIEQAR
jgi:DUF4097 and DUF4098 domain-containing protein YvlB